MEIFMKKSVGAVLAACIITAASTAFAGSEEITVILDGSTLSFDVEPQIINERTMVPLRTIFESIGAEVEWDEQTRTITSKKDGTTVEMEIDSYDMYINGEAVTLEAAPTIIDSRTLVPVRAVAESFGADVSWEDGSRTVIILNDAKDSVVNAVIDVEDYGEIQLMLFENTAPKTVANFKQLANSGFYSGLIFHRVINGFMIQGGGYDIGFNEGEASAIQGEFSSNGIENNLSHTRGVISMARTSEPDSATSQFFIVHEDSQYLDGEYAAFGIVTDGMEVVDKIAETSTGSLPSLGLTNLPTNPIKIGSVTIK